MTQLGDLWKPSKEFVSSLASTVPVAGNAGHYARIVKVNAMLQRLLEEGVTAFEVGARPRAEPRTVERAEAMM